MKLQIILSMLATVFLTCIQDSLCDTVPCEVLIKLSDLTLYHSMKNIDLVLVWPFWKQDFYCRELIKQRPFPLLTSRYLLSLIYVGEDIWDDFDELGISFEVVLVLHHSFEFRLIATVNMPIPLMLRRFLLRM